MDGGNVSPEVPLRPTVYGRLYTTDTSWRPAGNVSATHRAGSPLSHAVALFLWQVVPPPVILLGTTGNALSFVVMSRRKLRDTTMSVCLRALAVVDTIVLWSGYFRLWWWKLTGTDIRSSSHVLCKVNSLAVQLSTQFASWVLLCIAVDRFIAVYRPHLARRVCTKAKMALALLVIFLCLSAVNLHFFWSAAVVPPGHCHINPRYPELHFFLRHVWPWLDLSLYCLVPFVLIAICNLAIITKMHCSDKRNRRGFGFGFSRRQILTRAKVHTMTYTLIIICTAFLVATLPICVFLLLFMSRLHRLSPTEELWFAVVNLLSYLNSACNFLLYLLSSSFFRAELLDMLCCSRQRSLELGADGPLVGSSSNGVAQLAHASAVDNDASVVRLMAEVKTAESL